MNGNCTEHWERPRYALRCPGKSRIPRHMSSPLELGESRRHSSALVQHKQVQGTRRVWWPCSGLSNTKAAQPDRPHSLVCLLDQLRPVTNGMIHVTTVDVVEGVGLVRPLCFGVLDLERAIWGHPEAT